MPNIAGTRRCSCPSRRLCCTWRKRTTACAVVRRTVSRPFAIVPLLPKSGGRYRSTCRPYRPEERHRKRRLVEDHGLDLGHLLDRVARPLAADAAALEPAVGLQVGAPERRPVDVDVAR